MYTAEGGRAQSVHSLYTTAHRRVQTVYTAVHGLCTWSVRDRVHGRVYGPCALRCTYRVYGRVHGRSRRVRTVYTAVHGPRTWSVRNPITAVYAARSRPCTVNTAVFTARVHGIVRTVYTAVHGVYRSCTPACKGRVHGTSTAMNRVHLHGRVLCTRPCLRPVYTAAHGRVTRPLTAVYRLCTRPCTGHVHGPSVTRSRPCTRPVHGRVPWTRPSLRPVCTALYVPCTRPFTAWTDRVHRRARAVYMVRPRPCTGYTYTVGYSVHGLVYGPCTWRSRPCTNCVHGRARATYMIRPWPDHGRVRGPYTAVYREHGRLYGPSTEFMQCQSM